MNLAVATLCIGGGAAKFARYSHPTFRHYAAKVGADFVVINSPKVRFAGPCSFNPLLFEKYQLADLLERYDRVLYLDTDVLVTPHAPDVFDEVPFDRVGGVFEDFGMDEDDRRARIRACQEDLGDVGWREGFVNSGVLVVSSVHKAAFTCWKELGVHDSKYEQTCTNWYIRACGFEVHPLDHRFNYMGISRVYFGPPHRKAYFIHYAGGGIFPWIPRERQIREDYEYFYGRLPGDEPLDELLVPNEAMDDDWFEGDEE
ncbi:MAG: hypothetical protein Kow0069_15140 [Promethearchaeota archaeon]